VFVDLKAAYDTVWGDGIVLKFKNSVSCSKLCIQLDNMLVNHYFQVFLGVKNIMIYHRAALTTSKQFQYADDIALIYQAKFEVNLEMDLEILNKSLRRWRLESNSGKTKMCVFHLSTHDANRKLEVMFDNT
jgi:hypothetical protein